MLKFVKMHGLGNDFVIFDARQYPLPTLDIKAIAARRTGVGCDQVILLTTSEVADVKMLIFNADGSEASACGNAARCVAQIIGKEYGKIEAGPRVLAFTKHGSEYSINMGRAIIVWSFDAKSRECEELGLSPGNLGFNFQRVAFVDVGNPHLVFIVPHKVGRLGIEMHGSKLERHNMFPNGVNVGFAHILQHDAIELCVWERGAGITLACGTGACAAVAACYNNGNIEPKCEVILPGGELIITVAKNMDIFMQGPVKTVFEGQIPRI